MFDFFYQFVEMVNRARWCHAVLKVEAKSSRPSSKKAIGQLKGRLSKSTSVKPTPEDSAASPTESRESKDSDDVPLVIGNLNL